jgi:SAM-dependent methyltransferase
MRVNYDEIAHLYDEPARDHQVDRYLRAFLDLNPNIEQSKVRVLDVGCGTGKQLRANRSTLHDLQMIGLDRFRGMLRVGKSACPSVAWIQGDGAELPFASGSFDYATSQFSYQHVRNTEKLIAELFRVLKPSGRFVMTNIDPWSMTGWSIYRYFPEALDVDYQDFMPLDQFIALMVDAGFRDILSERTRIDQNESVRRFLAYASERHRASQFMAISDAAYDAGLRKLNEDASKVDKHDKRLESEFVLVTVSGDRPR